MPVSIKFHTALKLVVVEGTGTISDQDWLVTFPRLWSDPMFDRSFDKLIDTRGVTHFNVTNSAIFALGDKMRKIYAGFPKCKTAVVAPLPVVHGIARQHQLITDGMAPETRVFWTYEEACAWLGRTPAELAEPATIADKK